MLIIERSVLGDTLNGTPFETAQSASPRNFPDPCHLILLSCRSAELRSFSREYLEISESVQKMNSKLSQGTMTFVAQSSMTGLFEPLRT